MLRSSSAFDSGIDEKEKRSGEGDFAQVAKTNRAVLQVEEPLGGETKCGD